MSHRILLRIAAICMLIHFLGHTMGHFMWRDTPGAESVIAAMSGTEFSFMGAERSFADYYEGYSWFVVFTLAAVTVWLWELSRRAVDARLLFPLGMMLIGFAVIEAFHFFPFASAMSAVAGACTLGAAFRRPTT
jgi:hypothetical protein